MVWAAGLHVVRDSHSLVSKYHSSAGGLQPHPHGLIGKLRQGLALRRPSSPHGWGLCTGPGLATTEGVEGLGPRAGGPTPQTDTAAALGFTQGVHGRQVSRLFSPSVPGKLGVAGLTRSKKRAPSLGRVSQSGYSPPPPTVPLWLKGKRTASGPQEDNGRDKPPVWV